MTDTFTAGQKVKLTRSFGGLDPGSPGRVVGRYARGRETYVVNFYEDDVDDVPPDVLEPAEDG